MRKQDIKPGVVYACQRGRGDYDSPQPIVFLTAPADGVLYHQRDRYTRSSGKPAFARAREGAKPNVARGPWASSGDTGYPAVMLYEHGEDKANPEDLLAVTLAGFQATTKTVVKGIRFTVVPSLTPVVGEWAPVVAEHDARDQARRELAARVRQETDASRARAIDIVTRLSAYDIAVNRIPSYGAVETVSLPLDEAEKLIALLGAKSGQED